MHDDWVLTKLTQVLGSVNWHGQTLKYIYILIVYLYKFLKICQIIDG